MAAPCNLLRSMGHRVLTFTRIVRENGMKGFHDLYRPCPGYQTDIVEFSVHSGADYQQFLQHTGCNIQIHQKSSTDVATSTAAEAEKMPVIIDNDLISKMLKDMEDNMPVSDMPNPFDKEHKKCILCKYGLDVNYKNVRLLSQFVSPYTGRIYGRAVTGLCIPMQKQVARVLKQSRAAGYMPYMFKKSEFMKDPRLFDPFKRPK